MTSSKGINPEQLIVDLPSMMRNDLDFSNFYAVTECLDTHDDSGVRGMAYVIRGHLMIAEGMLEQLSSRGLI